ncbi:MAG: hypothetical protein FWH26_03015 [Oscillospiraceae bacterium]|nr:hypothetical protein [Oscillospiraceae bacterium]
MKNIRKLLAVLLGFALVFTLAVPAFAEEENPPPVFTQELAAATHKRANKDVVLETQAKLPDGVDAELKYQWYYAEINFDDLEFFLDIISNALDDIMMDISERQDVDFLPFFEDLTYIPLEGAIEPSFVVPRPSELLETLTNRVFRVQAYYEDEDNTIVESNSYTLFFHRYSSIDLYRIIFEKTQPGESLIVRVLAFPLVLPILLLLKFLIGISGNAVLIQMKMLQFVERVYAFIGMLSPQG